MTTVYNRIASQSPERLAALSDGLFAIAMTLLVLDIRLPAAQGISEERQLWGALLALSPRLIVWLMSFLTLGIFWVGQQTQLNFFARSDRNLAWIHLAFLASASLMPLSTALLGEFIAFRTALAAYWVNLVLLGATLYASWAYASRAGLLKAEASAEIAHAIRHRIVIGQALYALGALLCLIDTFWSIAFIVALQLNFAIAPRIRPLFRI
jgi:uncharacterized membrane protein